MHNFNPDTDGIDHINIYSKGKTYLGQQLTNLAHTPFIHDGHQFTSMEAYWFYTKARLQGVPYDHFPTMPPFTAKKVGSQLDKEVPSFEEFKEYIKTGIKDKLRYNTHLIKHLTASTLPFTHYYAYGSTEKGWRVIDQQQHHWQCEYFEELRNICKEYYGRSS